MDVSRCVTAVSRVLALGVLLAIGTTGRAVAQSELQSQSETTQPDGRSLISVRGNVGASFFRSPDLLKTVLHSGTNLGLEAHLHVFRGVSLTVGGTYNSFALNRENALLYRQDGGNLSFLGGSVGIQYTFLNRTDAHPYLAMGMGVYQLRRTNRQRVEDGTLVPVEGRETRLQEGVHLAAGSLFRIDDTYAVFVEPRYMFFDTSRGVGDATRYFTLRLGVDVQL